MPRRSSSVAGRTVMAAQCCKIQPRRKGQSERRMKNCCLTWPHQTAATICPIELLQRIMLRVQPIATLDLPELAPYRTMRRQLEHREQGIFVAEGEKVVRRLLESQLTVVSLLLPEKWLREYEPLLAAQTQEIHAYVAEKELLESLTGFSM